MNYQMLLQVISPAESLGAKVTFVRFLSCVHQNVTLEVLQPLEELTASWDLADKGLGFVIALEVFGDQLK